MNNDWETANYEALMFSLRPYESKLSVTRNSKLNSKDREIDVRIITDLPELPESELKAKLKNHAIARAFKKHNIVELKNPGEALSINTFWKGISYAAQYVNFSITQHPLKLFKVTDTPYYVYNCKIMI